MTEDSLFVLYHFPHLKWRDCQKSCVFLTANQNNIKHDSYSPFGFNSSFEYAAPVRAGGSGSKAQPLGR